VKQFLGATGIIYTTVYKMTTDHITVCYSSIFYTGRKIITIVAFSNTQFTRLLERDASSKSNVQKRHICVIT